MWMTNEYHSVGQMVQTHSMLCANLANLQTSHAIRTSSRGKLALSLLLNDCTFFWQMYFLLHGQFPHVNCTTKSCMPIMSKTFYFKLIQNSKLQPCLWIFSHKGNFGNLYGMINLSVEMRDCKIERLWKIQKKKLCTNSGKLFCLTEVL